MKPVKKKVLIKPKAEEEVTESGIYKVDAHSKNQAEGEVIGVGDEVTLVDVGMRVFYSPLLYEEITQGDTQYHVLDENDIHAIIES